MALTETQISPPTQPMSFKEYMAWGDEDIRSELVNGQVIIMSPISKKHQEIANFLTKILGIYTEETNNGTLLTAPFAMRLSDQTVREPDLLFVSSANQSQLKETYLDGPADIVIEIISPKSIGRDRGEKFVEYENAGVQEYWLIDPIRQQIEFYHLSHSRYQIIHPDNDMYQTDLLPNFFLKPNWLWQDPLPRVLDTLKELQII